MMYLVKVSDVNNCKYFKTKTNWCDIKLSELSQNFLSRIKTTLNAKECELDQEKCKRLLNCFYDNINWFNLAPHNKDLTLAEAVGTCVKIVKKIDGRSKFAKELEWFTLFKLLK